MKQLIETFDDLIKPKNKFTDAEYIMFRKIHDELQMHYRETTGDMLSVIDGEDLEEVINDFYVDYTAPAYSGEGIVEYCRSTRLDGLEKSLVGLQEKWIYYCDKAGLDNCLSTVDFSKILESDIVIAGFSENVVYANYRDFLWDNIEWIFSEWVEMMEEKIEYYYDEVYEDPDHEYRPIEKQDKEKFEHLKETLDEITRDHDAFIKRIKL